MSSVSKEAKKIEKLKNKRGGIVQTFVVCKEAVHRNKLTPAQRNLMKAWLRPLLKEIESEIIVHKLKINQLHTENMKRAYD